MKHYKYYVIFNLYLLINIQHWFKYNHVQSDISGQNMKFMNIHELLYDLQFFILVMERI